MGICVEREFSEMLNNLQQSGDCRQSVWSHQLGFNGLLVVDSSVPLFSALEVQFVGSLEIHLSDW